MQFETAEDIAKKTNEYLRDIKIDYEIIAIPKKIKDAWQVAVVEKR